MKKEIEIRLLALATKERLTNPQQHPMILFQCANILCTLNWILQEEMPPELADLKECSELFDKIVLQKAINESSKPNNT